MAEVNARQAEIAERLQEKWLTHIEKLLDAGTITSTDLATLARVLLQNGWSLDPKNLPQSLKDKIPNLPDPASFDDDDVIGRIA